jgi:hypothetical protein
MRKKHRSTDRSGIIFVGSGVHAMTYNPGVERFLLKEERKGRIKIRVIIWLKKLCKKVRGA